MIWTLYKTHGIPFFPNSVLTVIDNGCYLTGAADNWREKGSEPRRASGPGGQEVINIRANCD